MEHYKILTQTLDNFPPFYKDLELGNVIPGFSQYSVGIAYSPNYYNKMLSNDDIYEVFIKKSVKQLLMSNHKFLALVEKQRDFKLKIIDLELKDLEFDALLTEEEHELELHLLDIEFLKSLLENNYYEIKKTTFLLNGIYHFTLKSNGVIGLDSEIKESHEDVLMSLIDFLGYGPKGYFS